MNIVFMGTPDFAVAALDALINAEHNITAAFTRVDKPRNRGKKMTFSPVKEKALSHNIPVEQPSTLKSSEAVELIRGYNPDCVVVAAYGMLLPQEVLDIPKYGCINIHASLLPKWRGAAPINRCIMNGDAETGITIMQMDKGLDTGDMLLSEKVVVDGEITATKLHDVLAELGGKLIVNVLNNVENIQKVKQNDEQATYASMLTKQECEIDFSRSANDVNNHIRGLADYPCAFTVYNDRRLKVYKAHIGETDGIQMLCGESGTEKITLTEVQPEGGKRMKAVDYLRGIRK